LLALSAPMLYTGVMADFWTDLARHLARYERAERDADIEETMTNEADAFHVYGELADVIPADLVADPDEPAWYTDGTRFVYRAGIDGDPWGREGLVLG